MAIFAVLFLSVLNLGLGFALAVHLESVDLRLPRPPRRRSQSQADKNEGRKTMPSSVAPTNWTGAGQLEISKKWADVLEGETEVASQFVETSSRVLQLEVGSYRERLVEIDLKLRSLAGPSKEEDLAQLLTDVKKANEDWLSQQKEGAAVLEAGRENLGEFEQLGRKLADVLLDQSAQIETTSNNLDVMDFESDFSAGSRRLIIEVRKLADLAHSLRDRINEGLLGIAKAESKILTLDEELQFDSMTGIRGVSGMEVAFEEFWRDDPERRRIVSCGLIDLDRFARLLDTHGIAAGDRLLKALAGELANLVRDDRGYDVVARISGQQFLVFLCDTGTRNGGSAMERIRQMIEACTFQLDEETIQMKVTCSVTEWHPDDTSESIYARSQEIIMAAKSGGRNQTYLDEGNGPKPVDPPSYNVLAKTIDCTKV